MITDDSKLGPFKEHTKSFDHQAKDFVLSRDLKYYAFFWEMGLGKSKIIIDTAAWLFLRGEIDGVVIISDKGAYRNWVDYEVPIHMMPGIPYRAAHWASSLPTKEIKKVDQLLRAQDNVLDILVINVEAFVSDRALTFVNAFLESHYVMGVIDESTSIKNTASKRTQAILSLRNRMDYKRILTGTPIANNPLDLYSQFEFLSPGLLGHHSFVAFRAEFADMMLFDLGRGKKFYKVVRFKNIEKLQERIRPHSSRRLKTECLDLPEKIYQTVYVDHTPEQARAYRDLLETAVIELSTNQLVTSTSALTTLTKLHQISCGHLKLDDKTTVDIPSNRVSEALRLMEIVDDKVIIWAVFRRDIEMLVEAITEKYGEGSVEHYYGDTVDRPGAIERFRTDPKVRAFVSNPATGGKGITLLESNYVIYYSNSFHLERRLQSEDRNHRIGQHRPCTYVDLCSPNTVDVKIVRALRDKKNLASEVLDVYRDMLCPFV